jgi:hypothetical protein
MKKNMAIQDPSPDKLEGMTRLAFGILLILVGVGVFFWVLSSAMELLAGNPSFAIMEKLPGIKEGISITTPKGPITLPPDMMQLSAYGIIIIILSVIIHAGSAMLKAGSHLLQPEVRNALRKISRKIKDSVD